MVCVRVCVCVCVCVCVKVCTIQVYKKVSNTDLSQTNYATSLTVDFCKVCTLLVEHDKEPPVARLATHHPVVGQSTHDRLSLFNPENKEPDNRLVLCPDDF